MNKFKLYNISLYLLLTCTNLPNLRAALHKHIAQATKEINQIKNNMDLIQAIENLDEEEIKNLLQEGADINTKDSNGNTPLIKLIKYKNINLKDKPEEVNKIVEIIRYITKSKLGNFKRADLNLKNNEGKFPLYVAAENNDLDTVEFLLNNPYNLADVNLRDNEGNTALMIAAQKGYRDIVKSLLDHKADPDLKNNKGQTALDLAKENQHHNIVTLLENFYLNKDKSKIIESTKKEISGKKETPEDLVLLFKAIANGDKNAVINILQENKDLDINQELYSQRTKNYKTPLISAVEKNNYDIAKILLEHKADPNKLVHLENPLSIAIRNKNLDMVKLLLEYKADVNKEYHNGETPLMIAIEEKNIPIIEALLKHNANTNQADHFARTPLFLEVSKDDPNPEIVKLLLEYKANPNHMYTVSKGKILTIMDYIKKNRPNLLNLFNLSK